MAYTTNNWYDSSVNSNILKSTYITGFLDVSRNVLGRQHLIVNNEKYVGNARFGLGTFDPSASIHIVANDPCVDFTNASISESTQNNQILGKIEFVSPSYTFGSNNPSNMIRCENIADDYDNNGSLIFGRDNADILTITSNGNVGVGNSEPSERLDINGGIEFLSSSINGYIHGERGLNVESATGTTLSLASSNKIIFGSGPEKTNMVLNNTGVGINKIDPTYALEVDDMRVSNRLYVKCSTTISDYSGFINANIDDGYYDWNVYEASSAYEAKWQGVTSVTLKPGIWLLTARIRMSMRKNKNSGNAIGIRNFGVGMGTDTAGTSYTTSMRSKRHDYYGRIRTINNTQYPANYLRLHVTTAKVITSSTKVYLGVHVCSASHGRTNMYLNGWLDAVLVNALV